MSEHTNTDLTPPTKQRKGKSKEAEGAPTPAASPSANGESVPTGTSTEAEPAKKPRQPRMDYGYAPNSVIRVVSGVDHKYRGARLEWLERVVAFEGKTAEEFEKAYITMTNKKGNPEPPRGWLRFFVQQGNITLEKVESPPPAASPAA